MWLLLGDGGRWAVEMMRGHAEDGSGSHADKTTKKPSREGRDGGGGQLGPAGAHGAGRNTSGTYGKVEDGTQCVVTQTGLWPWGGTATWGRLREGRHHVWE